MRERKELSGGLYGVESVEGKGTPVLASWLFTENNRSPMNRLLGAFTIKVAFSYLSKNQVFEDQSEPFPYSFRGFTIRKILSLLKTQIPPLLTWIPY